MNRGLIQRIVRDDAESHSTQPLNDDVFGEAIAGGLLNAEGDEWRWQRQLAAPLFRAELGVGQWGPARTAVRCLPHPSFGRTGIADVRVSRIDCERVHLTAYDIIVGERSPERPDGIPSFHTSSRTENSESKIEAFARSFIAVLLWPQS